MSRFSSSSPAREVAMKQFILENDIQKVKQDDEIFYFNPVEQSDITSARPWDKDKNYFKEVKINATALLKMVMHARSGGNIEVMGLITGKIMPNTMVVLDSFSVPVLGTETRVDLLDQSYAYMINYAQSQENLNRSCRVIGWYHSHPGYGCWLSGIDVQTQSQQQEFQEPFVAIVVDPIRTMSAGKVDIGAFRTYPKWYTSAEDEPEQYQSVPLNKIHDFGVHSKKYYRLDVSYFMSSLDTQIFESLWSKHWTLTLSSCPLMNNAAFITDQITDLSKKLENCCSNKKILFKIHDDRLEKVEKDSRYITSESIHGLMAQMLKVNLFKQLSPQPENVDISMN